MYGPSCIADFFAARLTPYNVKAVRHLIVFYCIGEVVLGKLKCLKLTQVGLESTTSGIHVQC